MGEDNMVSRDPHIDQCGEQPEAATSATAALAPEYVIAALRGLTPVQKRHIINGTFSGDFRMDTVFVLKRKGIFYHKITSPNGRGGPMVLTPLGEAVREILRAAALPASTPEA